MLLQGDQRPQTLRRQVIQQQKGTRPIAREMLMPPHIGLAEHQRLRLRQHIGQQQFMVRWQSVPCLLHRHKLHRHNIRALVQHLKIGMLPVGAGFTP